MLYFEFYIMFFDRKVVLTGKTLLFSSCSVQLLIMLGRARKDGVS